MTCASFPDVTLAPVHAARPSLRSVATVGAASALVVPYGWLVASEASRRAHGGDLALHLVGFGLALAAVGGAWAALRGSEGGRAIAVRAAQGNLFLLVAAVALAVWDEVAVPSRLGADPLVALAALGALQAAALVLALASGAPRSLARARTVAYASSASRG